MPTTSLRRGFLMKGLAALAGATVFSTFLRGTTQSQAKKSGPQSIADGDPFLGEIALVPYTFAPQGWAFCNGQILPISQNTALFSLLGTTYGGDGISTFALPDLRGRVPISSGQGPGLSDYTVGQTGGEENHTLTVNEMPSHAHNAQGTTAVGLSDNPSNAVPAKNAAGIPQYGMGTLAPMAGAAIQSNGGGLPHNNLPPYLSMNYIIALVGIYPTR